MSPVNFVKGPGIVEAALPNFIHKLGRLRFIAVDLRTHHQAQHRSSPDAALEVAGELPLSSRQKLPCEPALSAERRRTYLRACLMPHVAQISLEPHVIIRVDQLMGKRVFEVATVAKRIGANLHSVLLVVSADGGAVDSIIDGAASTASEFRLEVGTDLGYLFSHEAYDWTCEGGLALSNR
jgi:hypothetical protein